MLDDTLFALPAGEQRRRVEQVVKRHALDTRDEAELIAMLGLDQDEPAPPQKHHPHDLLSAAELHDLLAVFAAPENRRARPSGHARR
ncbi:hypothetical protein ACGFMK_24765 [Amycolatopsis sp. NPDC049252]|uniref:hypothetical protein n=1 Tax=Amycolatopsis sp. NPDC049252 TaxID=3363933 RepID=UPI003711A725